MGRTVIAADVRRSIERDAAAVVAGLAAADHADEHLSGTVTVPYDEVDERFPETFDGSDELVADCRDERCRDERCRAGPEAAAIPEETGPGDVRDYGAGVVGWTERGHGIGSGSGTRPA
jgi:hypothetical protein